MRILKLYLQNFRGFCSVHLDFNHDVTVLVGINGAGKTSVLEAVALALTCVAKSMRAGHVEEMTLPSCVIQEGSSQASVTVEAEIEGTSCAWTTRSAGMSDPPGTDGPLEVLTAPLAAVSDSIAAGAPRLPLAVYYPAHRAALDAPAGVGSPRAFDMFDAYEGALDGGTAGFRDFFEWFREEEDLLHEEMLSAPDLEPAAVNGSRLPHVKRAIEEFFPGARELRIERRHRRMTLAHNGTQLDVMHLSEGERCLLAMVGDLARRMALAAPRSDNPLAHPVVVLIDEPELHLHPGLQRTILQRLKRVFPNAQFLISSHSPHMLSSVQTANVRVLDRFEIRPLEREPRRRDSVQSARFRSQTPPPGPVEDVAEKLRELREVLEEKS